MSKITLRQIDDAASAGRWAVDLDGHRIGIVQKAGLYDGSAKSTPWSFHARVRDFYSRSEVYMMKRVGNCRTRKEAINCLVEMDARATSRRG